MLLFQGFHEALVQQRKGQPVPLMSVALPSQDWIHWHGGGVEVCRSVETRIRPIPALTYGWPGPCHLQFSLDSQQQILQHRQGPTGVHEEEVWDLGDRLPQWRAA